MELYDIAESFVLKYAHIPIDKDKFIFPIEGLNLSYNELFKVGKIDFIDRDYLINNIINKRLEESSLFKKEFKNVKTFAVVNLKKFDDYKEKCKAGNNSLALQILKQTIGALYLSIYNNKCYADCERKISISNKGILQVEEGLNSYLFSESGKYKVWPNDVHESLIAKYEDFDINSISSIVKILKKDFNYRTEYEKRICKVLELIYAIYDECNASERIIKWSIVLNFIFRENNEQNLDSTDIGRKLRILFNVVENKNIFEENLPKHVFREELKTRKISGIVVEVYKSVRNDLMHGKIDFYSEYGVCNTTDLMILKVTTLELIKIMVKQEYLKKFKTIKEFSDFLEEKEKEYSEERKKLKKEKKELSIN